MNGGRSLAGESAVETTPAWVVDLGQGRESRNIENDRRMSILMNLSDWHIGAWRNRGRHPSAPWRFVSAMLCAVVLVAAGAHATDARAAEARTIAALGESGDGSTDPGTSDGDRKTQLGCVSGTVCGMVAVADASAMTWGVESQRSMGAPGTALLRGRELSPLFRPPKPSDRV